MNKLKGAIKGAKKDFLKDLINPNSDKVARRVLMKKLLDENRSIISNELAAIRFNFKNYMERNQDQNESASGLEVNFEDLPEELFAHIETMIKTERPEVDEGNGQFRINFPLGDDSIIEVPVPPKPPVPVITLDEDDNDATNKHPEDEADKSPDKELAAPKSRSVSASNNESHTEDNNISKDSAKMERLNAIMEEQANLVDQLKELDKQRCEIMARLDCLQELQKQVFQGNSEPI